MESKNSRMRNSVGIGLCHLHNSFKFTERVWREVKSLGNADGKHVFRLEIPFGNFGLPVKPESRFLQKFPFGTTKISVPLTFQPKLPDFFGKW